MGLSVWWLGVVGSEGKKAIEGGQSSEGGGGGLGGSLGPEGEGEGSSANCS